MLDGLLNRGFSSKCKSLIKDAMKRLEVVRRRAEAKQRFLKEDLVKLLANGLDINAYGRTEEFLAGLNLLSCYDFIAYTCEYILKLLSSMQKQRECPEDCREAVASLMFAAARFSDLPELRDLRDLFQERYGSEMQCYVNQKFLEKLSPLPPTEAKRFQLLQDISTEFSIKWDRKGFEQSMVGGSSTYTQVQSSINGFNGDGNGVIYKKSDASPKPRHVVNDKETHLIYHEKPEKRGQEQLPSTNTNNTSARRKELVSKREEGKVDKNESSNNKDDNRSDMLWKHIDIGTSSFREKSKSSPSYKVFNSRNEEMYFGKEPIDTQKPGISRSDSLKDNKHNVLLPPPYVKNIHNPIPPPYTKPKEGKLVSTNKPEDAISKCEGLPRPRSIRKKQHKHYDDDNDDSSNMEEGGVVNRSSISSRRKGNSRKGLFEDENHGKDEEERIMDKLLLHYSKKLSTYDIAESSSSHNKKTSETISSSSMRSISLPNEQKNNVTATESTSKKFNRVQSFQQDNRASHVHPKLPEYDDLAARLAALRG